ncbi:MAG: hypothetical protein IT303_17045 [Dehalococcoidia bacterium]|nr:hypothetical protein [Dehalococcoidia bacterium]
MRSTNEDRRRLDHVWSRVVRHAGEEFRTTRGRPFRYVVSGDGLLIDRVQQQLSRELMEKAFARAPLKNTADVADLWGMSYVYAIVMDDRIRAAAW